MVSAPVRQLPTASRQPLHALVHAPLVQVCEPTHEVHAPPPLPHEVPSLPGMHWPLRQQPEAQVEGPQDAPPSVPPSPFAPPSSPPVPPSSLTSGAPRQVNSSQTWPTLHTEQVTPSVPHASSAVPSRQMPSLSQQPLQLEGRHRACCVGPHASAIEKPNAAPRTSARLIMESSLAPLRFVEADLRA